MSIKDLTINNRFLIESLDKYDNFLIEIKVLNITSKAIKWERQDRKEEDRSPSWILASRFKREFSIVEKLED